MNETISVVIPSYNRATLIGRAIESVLQQTYSNIEIIVVDDASTDETESVVKRIKNDKLHYIKLKKNGGACKARNVGIRASKGEYIAFLDSDDIWNTDKLEKQMKILQEKKAKVVACNGWYEKANTKRLIANRQDIEIVDFNDLLNAK